MSANGSANACHVVDGPFGPAALLPLQAGARGHQRIVAGPIGVLVVAPVGGDRAVDQPRVRLGQGRVVDPQPLRGPRGEALDQHVGLRGQREEACLVGLVLEVEHRAALAALPHLVAELAAERISGGRLDLGDLRALVCQEHRRHRTGDAPRQVKDAYSVQYARHCGAQDGRPKTRSALPLRILARSFSGMPALPNWSAITLRELGQQVAGCGKSVDQYRQSGPK